LGIGFRLQQELAGSPVGHVNKLQDVRRADADARTGATIATVSPEQVRTMQAKLSQ
jgi:hypothetical protein